VVVVVVVVVLLLLLLLRSAVNFNLKIKSGTLTRIQSRSNLP
jgi:hypothetical protein